MAAMSVIGIDLGNESCYVAVAKAGGIETIANDYSLRATPACVAFSGKNRVLGVAAKNQQVTNISSTIYSFKRLLGKKFRDERVQFEQKYLPYTMVEMKDGSIGIKVNYLNEERVYSPEQCLAMLFTKLKDTSETAIQTQVKDCVISVPSYFTVKERQALLDAANIADLNVLSLLNETTATALAYGIYKQDLPGPEENARNVVFVDCGQSSLQASVCAFNKGKLEMLSTAFDSNLGGRNIDFELAEYFKEEFKKKYKIHVDSNPRAYIRLLAEVEKLKKQMSANSTTLPFNIECFMDDKDVRGEMKRADMEKMCEHFFAQVKNTLEECLARSGLNKEDIHSVEVVGGSTRIPGIKNLIKEIFGYTPSTTLNQDEAVSRGCALQCAILSPAVRVKDFHVTDVLNYTVCVELTDSIGGKVVENIPLFDLKTKFPLSRKMTVKKSEPFEIRAFYTCNNIPYMDKEIGKWIIKDVKPTADGQRQNVMVTFTIKLDGTIYLKTAAIQTTETAEVDSMEVEKQQDENAEPQPSAETANTAVTSEENKEKKPKSTKKLLHLPVEFGNSLGLSKHQMEDCRERELEMKSADKQEKERVDARNALEEYVYELRSKLSSQDELAQYVTEASRDDLVRKLDDMENWLYEEGEDCQRQEYKDKLKQLKTLGDPIETRRMEYEKLPVILQEFGGCLQIKAKSRTAISKDQKYAHLTKEDFDQVDQCINRYFKYVNDCYASINNQQKHIDSTLKVKDVEKEFQNFITTIDPILNKPPPKTPSPPKEQQVNDTQNGEQKQNAENQNQGEQQQNHQTEPMDVDRQ